MRAVHAPLARSVAALGLVLVLTGCSSLNPFNWFGGSNEPKPAPLVEIVKPLTVRTIWQARVGSSHGHALTPAIAGGSVYAAAYDGTLARFDEASGKEVWRVDVGNAVSGGVGSDGERVVVGTTEGEVITLDNNGRVMWRARVSSEVLASPVVAGDVVVVRSADSRIFGLSAIDGKRLWVYQRAAPALSVRSTAGIVVRGGFVFAGFAGGKLVAVALDNGGLRWEGTVALPKGTTELERVADVIGEPWVGEREACAVAYQGRVACFSLGSGSQIWAREMSSSAGLDLDSTHVYVSEDRGAVSALDRANGASIWRQDKLTNRHVSAPLSIGPEIVVGDLQGLVHWLTRDDGAFAARYATDGSPIRATPVAFAQGFIVQTTNGGLYALSAE
ncbi:MAG TPA: outer membrane protein assembly factor BamB [Burkholderiales bacterium]